MEIAVYGTCLLWKLNVMDTAFSANGTKKLLLMEIAVYGI